MLVLEIVYLVLVVNLQIEGLQIFKVVDFEVLSDISRRKENIKYCVRVLDWVLFQKLLLERVCWLVVYYVSVNIQCFDL